MKMKKTKFLVTILSAVCLLAAINYTNALATAEYVNVKAGDTFEYTMVIGGTTAHNPWPGTYEVMLVIDNITDHGTNTTIAFHMVIKNSTETQNSYQTRNVKDSDTEPTPGNIFVINFHIVNKTYHVYNVYGPGDIEWTNGTWDANGVLERFSMLYLVGGEINTLKTFTRKGGIPAYPVLAVVMFMAVAVSILTRKKLHRIEN